MTRALWTAALVALLAAPAAAQEPGFHARFRLYGTYVAHQETGVDRLAEGPGGGAAVQLSWGRIVFEGSAYRAEMEPDWGGGAAFDLEQGDARLSVVVYAPFALEVGTGGRRMDPEFSAPDVGYFRFGGVTRTPLTRLAEITVRGAYLVPKFNGGGEAGFSIEVGLGASVGLPSGLVRFRAEYDFQRLDRKLNNVSMPLQFTAARVGFDVGF